MKQQRIAAAIAHRYSIKVAGESGQGVNSVGELIAKAVKESGLQTFGYREYPSLIKGGWSSHQTDISDIPINSSSAFCNLLVCMSRASLHIYLPTMHRGGLLIHTIQKLALSVEEQDLIDQLNLRLLYVPAAKRAIESGGMAIMANTVLVGVVWQLLGLPATPVETVLRSIFEKKPEVIEPNIICFKAGMSFDLEEVRLILPNFKTDAQRANDCLLTGNHALALGAVSAGVRAYYAYPMTPSSSILTYLANIYHETGMLVKQIEDEISVVQMALGSMFAGTRALVGTSGGGFDLMTETISLAGMTETPLVIILAQRPGPATGLPTWTSASDISVAIGGGHGEYPRIVIAGSDPTSCYRLIQEAFNFAEQYQTPVIVLTEKQIAESLYQVDTLPAALPIERHLVLSTEDIDQPKRENLKRYALTESGISPRWLPGSSDVTYNANSDEHLEDGSLTESAETSEEMYAKRLRKSAAILSQLPEPKVYGPLDAQITFVGWGSTKDCILDAMGIWNTNSNSTRFNYLHYEYIWPLKTERIKECISNNQQLVLIEQNALGQLGQLISQETGYVWKNRFLKFDGRPFFIEDILEYLQNWRDLNV